MVFFFVCCTTCRRGLPRVGKEQRMDDALVVMAWACGVVILVWGTLLFYVRRQLTALWREPVIKHPVLVLESDDWGAGPLVQAEALEQLRALLQRHHDGKGRPAVMTLGVILEVPDTQAMAKHPDSYLGKDVRAPEYAELRAVMDRGVRESVFALQLHGQCHYWPASLMAAAGQAPVAAWLYGPPHPRSEDLPSWLQSRWTDASRLPSQALPADAIAAATAKEAEIWRHVFGRLPAVAVPTTFVWTDAVESAWASAGIRCAVTPGRRLTRREADGSPGGVDKLIRNGQRGQGDILYVVRDAYFEPALGHAMHDLTAAVLQKWRARRPCLAEIHRFNFLGEENLQNSLRVLDGALSNVLKAVPALCFLATEKLADAMRARDPELIEGAFVPRFKAWLVRIREIPRFRKLCLASGLAVPFALLEHVL